MSKPIKDFEERLKENPAREELVQKIRLLISSEPYDTTKAALSILDLIDTLPPSL